MSWTEWPSWALEAPHHYLNPSTLSTSQQMESRIGSSLCLSWIEQPFGFFCHYRTGGGKDWGLEVHLSPYVVHLGCAIQKDLGCEKQRDKKKRSDKDTDMEGWAVEEKYKRRQDTNGEQFSHFPLYSHFGLFTRCSHLQKQHGFEYLKLEITAEEGYCTK